LSFLISIFQLGSVMTSMHATHV